MMNKMWLRTIEFSGGRSVSLGAHPDGGNAVLFSTPVADDTDLDDPNTTSVKIEDGKVKTYIRLSDEALANLVVLVINSEGL